MNADILFSNVEFFGAPSGQKVRVKVGETLQVQLNEAEAPFEWGTTADPILEVQDKHVNVVEITTLKVGESKLIVLNEELNTIFHIDFEVFDPNEATNLGMSAGDPEDK